jgi:hydroxypyruvate reductase
MSLRSDAIEIFNLAINSVLPATVLPSYIQLRNNLLILSEHKFEPRENTRIFAIAIGKAAAGMMQTVQHLLKDKIHQSLLITKEAHAINIENCLVIEADHPVPGKKSVEAADALLRFLNNTSSDDIILFLISGGASSLVTDVPGGLRFEDIQLTQKLLLLCGANIYEINTVRKHLSNVKGGQLIRYCNGATVFSFIISDVAGNDISVIGSGLTVPDKSKTADALKVLEKYDLLNKVPLTVIKYLKDKTKNESLFGDRLFEKVKNVVIADNNMALQMAAQKASALGYVVTSINNAMFGNTEIEAIKFSNEIKNYKGSRPACFIAGGETTINVKGNGKGGRNQHFALTMLHELLKNSYEENLFPVILASGTDGTDGPTDAAGAIIDYKIARQAGNENLLVEEYLSNNDSYNFFKRVNGLLISAPTQTNVMDIVIALVQ